jgi:ABC-2 type transport system ATP-binding protein
VKEAIYVKSLSKTFKIRKTFPGISGMLKGLFCTDVTILEAISNIDLTVAKGERIAFIGPNGAGKSTTIKMLTGILHPTSGSVEVLGLVPWKDRHTLGFKIGTVFGQRTQLWYHLPPSDTFDLLAQIYELDTAFYQRQLKELTEAFEITHLLHQPVRQLSLGQRMRCEIVASLLHNPQVLFLDEPTIGLDIGAKLKIREFLSHLSKKQGTTLFLTSHDTADIEHICERVIVLNQGRILKDCSLRELKKSYVKKKIITLITDEKHLDVCLHGMTVLKRGDYSLVCEIDLDTTPIEKLIHETLKLTNLKDVTIEDPTMTEIIQNLYKNEKIS